MVATTGVVPALVALKAAMFPAPEAANPIDGVSLTQLKAAPAVPVNVTSVVNVPLHTTWLPIAFTTGVGFTVMVKFVVAPVHDP